MYTLTVKVVVSCQNITAMNCGNSRQFDKVHSTLSELQNVPNFEMRFVFKIDVAVKQPPYIISLTWLSLPLC